MMTNLTALNNNAVGNQNNTDKELHISTAFLIIIKVIRFLFGLYDYHEMALG